MSYTRGFVVAIALVGCASATSPLEGTDASPATDGGRDASGDAPPGDAMIDAPPQCTIMNVNLLVNPAFDLLPLSTGWTETQIQGEPIVRNDGSVVAQSGANKAWLGGVVGLTVTDALHQDVAIPASATALRLTGFYEVRTNETTTVTAYDNATVSLTTTGGTLLASALAVSNLGKTTTWTAIDVPFATSYAGQTVRLKLTSSNDITNTTSFYFDTLALTATACQ